ncbi:MAG: General secretion pathway protein D / Type II secretion outermembrane pore forming protein (PulD) [uncultured Sulfurovum sp.]|uniref:General secretion pathway protein D / Type II secretion outermembrane pore forming protein (PulD) n=1 Tax=uncultured Sulfurovum sp. TaxID=269237 RepID=A0A6S6UCF9_9BACT|nr:MAG: General secretion pathway protein D / Type II secretion outermembrane pore forming protein (PulD) [uncultured Sulfurovum sp.]
MKLSKIVLSTLMVLTIGLYAEDEKVDVNFRDLAIKDFVEMVSKITQTNILVESEIKGKINFVSTTPIKKSSLLPLANSILGGKGLALVDLGDYYKVVKASKAAGEGLEVSSSIDGDTMKTVMFPLRNSNAAVVRAKIKPLLHKNAKVISFKENNVLAITANPRTLRAISKVINVVEKIGEKKTSIVILKNSSVKDVFKNAQNMAKKLFPQTIASEKVDIFKDEATNSIILVGKAENNNRMIGYIKQLDLKGEDLTQKMYVIPLKNSNVEEMEKILSKLVAQMNSVKVKTSKKGAKAAASSKAMVVSDLERNSLIILATGEQIRNIRDTIKKIDVPQAQVYVKARIIEINTNLAEQIGMRYGFEGGQITSQGLFSAAANLGASSLMISPTLTSFLNNQSSTVTESGAVITSNTRSFEFDSGIKEVFALGAKLDLLKQDGAAHVLSEPSVLCTNNKEATLQVGQTQSILTQAQQSTAGQGNIVNNYSREDIGITLKVTPRLSSHNKVTLQVEAEIEDILPGSNAAADRPTTTKRKVNTNAIVNNGETIILGGLMKSSGGVSSTKVPILGEIPVLGELFKSDADMDTQVNVVIYLTPYIVRKSGDLQRLRTALDELEGIQTRYNSFVRRGLEQRAEYEADDTEPTGDASNRIRHNSRYNNLYNTDSISGS